MDVRKDTWGFADGQVDYYFMDLWSRTTTWGGKLPPREGDMVVIPEGTTVVLDMSTPKLHTIVLFGTLKFDTTATQELHLRARHIILMGGTLEVRH